MKGLRQGDPLSPLIFLLAVDTLQALMQKIKHNFIEVPSVATTLLQFADNTAIVTLAHPNIKLVMATLEIFCQCFWSSC
jgi:hypothetical protein